MLTGVLLDGLLDRALPAAGEAGRRAFGGRRWQGVALYGAGLVAGMVAAIWGGGRVAAFVTGVHGADPRRGAPRRWGRRGRPRGDRRERHLLRARRRPGACRRRRPRLAARPSRVAARHAHVPRRLRGRAARRRRHRRRRPRDRRRPGHVGDLRGAAEPDPADAPHHLQLPAPVATVARLHAHALGLHRRRGGRHVRPRGGPRCAGTSSSASWRSASASARGGSTSTS